MARATRRRWFARTQQTPPPPPNTPTPMFGILRLVSPANEEVALLGGGRITPITHSVSAIGRAQHNAIVLLDPSVSRDHARLTARRNGWQIENISAANTLDAAGKTLAPGQEAALAPGDTLRLGQTILQLVAPHLKPVNQAEALASESGESNGWAPVPVPDEVEDQDAPDTYSSNSIFPSIGGSSIHLLNPGITLQFALRGHFTSRVRWAMGIGVALLLLVCTIITLGTAVLVGRGALATEGAGSVLAALTIPLAPAVGVAIVVTLLDRYEHEPWLLMLAAFLWGALIAIAPALFLEQRLIDLLGALPSIGVGGELLHAASQAFSAAVSEESIKGIGLLALLLLLRDEFDNVTDGIVYGALIGAGFAMVENFVYFAVIPRSDLGVLIFGRVILGWLSHSTFTAFFGAGLGLYRETRDHRLKWLAPLAGFLAALLLHTLFDFVAFGANALATPDLLAHAAALFALVILLAEYVPLFTAQAVLLQIALAALEREAEIVREYLVSEVLNGVVSSDEYLLLQNATLRDAAERAYGLEYGVRAWLTARTLYQTMTGLAFRKWHVAMGDPPKNMPRQPEEVYRTRIARLRRSLRRQVALRLPLRPAPDMRREAEPTRPLSQ